MVGALSSPTRVVDCFFRLCFSGSLSATPILGSVLTQVPGGRTVVLAEAAGSIVQNALLIADVDGDGLNEIVACTLSGNIFIYKGIVCHQLMPPVEQFEPATPLQHEAESPSAQRSCDFHSTLSAQIFFVFFLCNLG